MFKAWPKIPRLENEVYHITEKIDGTNAAIIIQPKPTMEEEPVPGWLASIETGHTAWGFPSYTLIYAQSRTRIITPEDDNYGFAKWVKGNAEQLIQDLGVGYHYGEWWGSGIQRGYGLDHKRFSLFNPTKYSSVCYNVPYIAECSAEELGTYIPALTYKLKQNGSYAAPGYMRPEGLVVYAEKAKTYWKVIIDK